MNEIRYYIDNTGRDVFEEWREQVMKDRSYDEAMTEVFRKDPAYVIELLNSILEDSEQAELLIALSHLVGQGQPGS
ncbi:MULTISPECIES: hypothetical protein [Photorhabdus]|uniref:hypothetical protein n=1 Tax=Photorhabdus TaxID=29487 RepID=UPI00267B17A4